MGVELPATGDALPRSLCAAAAAAALALSRAALSSASAGSGRGGRDETPYTWWLSPSASGA